MKDFDKVKEALKPMEDYNVELSSIKEDWDCNIYTFDLLVPVKWSVLVKKTNNRVESEYGDAENMTKEQAWLIKNMVKQGFKEIKKQTEE